MERLNGKVAIITGAAQGVGLCAVKMFLNEGAKVVATDINDEKLFKVIEELGTPDAVAVKHNVSSEEDWKKVIETAVSTFGKLDVLVNNAGIVTNKPITEQTLEEFHRVIDVSATGSYLGIKHCSEAMGTEGHSAIVNICSICGVCGGSRSGLDTAYNAAKGAERMITKHTAHFLANKNIRVNCILPGVIATDMYKAWLKVQPDYADTLKPFAPLAPHYSEPEDIANAIIFLASDEARTITGAELAVDNGYSSY